MSYGFEKSVKPCHFIKSLITRIFIDTCISDYDITVELFIPTCLVLAISQQLYQLTIQQKQTHTMHFDLLDECLIIALCLMTMIFLSSCNKLNFDPQAQD